MSLALALGAAVLVLAVYDVENRYFAYLFLPAVICLMPLASDRVIALILAAAVMLLFVFLEVLTIGVFYLPAAGAMATAAVLATRKPGV
jgi:hypothetical protein